MTDREKTEYEWLREKAAEHSPDCECDICIAFMETHFALFEVEGEEEGLTNSLPSGVF